MIDPGFEKPWRPLYRTGAVAALVVLGLVPIQLFVYSTSPPPETTLGWFALFERSPLLGLLDMDVLLIIDQVLIEVMLVAVVVALRASSRPQLVIAAVFGTIGFASYLASNPVFEMLALAKDYAAAATDVERAQFVAAGHVLRAQWVGTAFSVGYVLGGIAFFLVGLAMVRSDRFGRVTAWTGIIFGTASLVPASAGTIGLVFSLASLLPMWLWLALVARRLWTMGSVRSRADGSVASGEEVSPAR